MIFCSFLLFLSFFYHFYINIQKANEGRRSMLKDLSITYYSLSFTQSLLSINSSQDWLLGVPTRQALVFSSSLILFISLLFSNIWVFICISNFYIFFSLISLYSYLLLSIHLFLFRTFYSIFQSLFDRRIFEYLSIFVFVISNSY